MWISGSNRDDVGAEWSQLGEVLLLKIYQVPLRISGVDAPVFCGASTRTKFFATTITTREWTSPSLSSLSFCRLIDLLLLRAGL